MILGESYFIFPENKQKWLVSKIPNKLTDNSELIRIVMFGILINFIEKQDAFNVLEWTSDEDHRNVLNQLNTCYEYIVHERPLLNDKIIQMKDAYLLEIKDFDVDKMVQEKSLQEVHELQEQMEEKDKKILHKIIDYRDYLDIS